MPKYGDRKKVYVSFAIVPIPAEAESVERDPLLAKEQYEKIEKAVKAFQPWSYEIMQRYIFVPNFAKNEIEWTVSMEFEQMKTAAEVKTIQMKLSKTVSAEEHRKGIKFLKVAIPAVLKEIEERGDQ